MGTYRLSRKADDDLAGLYRFGVRAFGVKRADQYFDSLCERLDAIASNPMLYQALEYRDGYRRSVHPPHTIYYRIISDGLVEIVRILRGQDPEKSL